MVFFVDDLQWAGRTPLGLFDLVLSEEPIAGLLLVGAYREDDVDAAHPLAARCCPRWRDQAGAAAAATGQPARGRASSRMVAEMLHVDRDRGAGPGSRLIGQHTSGNPYETVELLDTLRRDGLLTATADGWRWDADGGARAPGRRRGGRTVGEPGSRPCRRRRGDGGGDGLSGRAGRGRPAADRDRPAGREVEQALTPALEDGLLVTEPGRHVRRCGSATTASARPS